MLRNLKYWFTWHLIGHRVLLELIKYHSAMILSTHKGETTVWYHHYEQTKVLLKQVEAGWRGLRDQEKR